MNKITFINCTTFPVTVSHQESKIKLNPNSVQNEDWLVLPAGSNEIQVKLHLGSWLLTNRTETIKLKLQPEDATYTISFFKESRELISQMYHLTIPRILLLTACLGLALQLLELYFVYEILIGVSVDFLILYALNTRKLKNHMKANDHMICLEKSN